MSCNPLTLISLCEFDSTPVSQISGSNIIRVPGPRHHVSRIPGDLSLNQVCMILWALTDTEQCIKRL